jgi:hypothetical protein
VLQCCEDDCSEPIEHLQTELTCGLRR